MAYKSRLMKCEASMGMYWPRPTALLVVEEDPGLEVLSALGFEPGAPQTHDAWIGGNLVMQAAQERGDGGRVELSQSYDASSRRVWRPTLPRAMVETASSKRHVRSRMGRWRGRVRLLAERGLQASPGPKRGPRVRARQGASWNRAPARR